MNMSGEHRVMENLTHQLRGPLTKDMKHAAAALDLPLAKSAMTLRQIYADAPGQGKVVWDMGTRAAEATTEVRYLFKELFPDVTKARTIKPREQVA